MLYVTIHTVCIYVQCCHVLWKWNSPGGLFSLNRHCVVFFQYHQQQYQSKAALEISIY